MCDPVVAMTAMAIAGGLTAKGQYDQGQIAKQTGRNNQIMAEYAAQDAIKRGEENAILVQQKARGLKGAQRANMAAKGLDLAGGTPGELLDQTDFFGAVDATTARQNAQREAWSARAGGANAAAQGDAASRAATQSAFATLIGTAGQVSSKWNDYSSKPKG